MAAAWLSKPSIELYAAAATFAMQNAAPATQFNCDRGGLMHGNQHGALLNQLAALSNPNVPNRGDMHSRFNLVELAAAAQVAASLQQQQQYSQMKQISNQNQSK